MRATNRKQDICPQNGFDANKLPDVVVGAFLDGGFVCVGCVPNEKST